MILGAGVRLRQFMLGDSYRRENSSPPGARVAGAHRNGWATGGADPAPSLSYGTRRIGTAPMVTCPEVMVFRVPSTE